MDFPAFEARAREIFDSIPTVYREGVDGLEVSRATVPHPTLPDIFTLGECRSEAYSTEFGGAGEIRSVVVLYYGSFLELSRLEEDWDWEGELWETITHEVRHHLESLATEDELEELDYAEDQNFARREGEAFDPFFYRSGTSLEKGVWEVDGDVFLEIPVEPAGAQGRVLAVRWRGRELAVPLPPALGDVHFVQLDEDSDRPGDVVAVLVRRRGWKEWLGALFRAAPLDVRQSAAPSAADDQ